MQACERAVGAGEARSGWVWFWGRQRDGAQSQFLTSVKLNVILVALPA